MQIPLKKEMKITMSNLDELFSWLVSVLRTIFRSLL